MEFHEPEIAEQPAPNILRPSHRIYVDSVPAGAEVYQGEFHNRGEACLGRTPLILDGDQFDDWTFTVAMPIDSYLAKLHTVPQLNAWVQNFEAEETHLRPEYRQDYFSRLVQTHGRLYNAYGHTTHIVAKYQEGHRPKPYFEEEEEETTKRLCAFFVPANVSPIDFFALMPPPGTYERPDPAKSRESHLKHIEQRSKYRQNDPSLNPEDYMFGSFSPTQLEIALDCLTRCGCYAVFMKDPIRVDAACRLEIIFHQRADTQTRSSASLGPMPCIEAPSPLSKDMIYIDSVPSGARVFAGLGTDQSAFGSSDDSRPAPQYLGVTPLMLSPTSYPERTFTLSMPMAHMTQLIRSTPQFADKIALFEAVLRRNTEGDAAFAAAGTIADSRSWNGEGVLQSVAFAYHLTGQNENRICTQFIPDLFNVADFYPLMYRPGSFYCEKQAFLQNQIEKELFTHQQAEEAYESYIRCGSYRAYTPDPKKRGALSVVTITGQINNTLITYRKSIQHRSISAQIFNSSRNISPPPMSVPLQAPSGASPYPQPSEDGGVPPVQPTTPAFQAPPVPWKSSAPANVPVGPQSKKSLLIAGLLGLFLGAFGAHRFYLGYYKIGAIMLIVSLLSPVLAWMHVPNVVILWGFIEGLLCLFGKMKDSDGNPVTRT